MSADCSGHVGTGFTPTRVTGRLRNSLTRRLICMKVNTECNIRHSQWGKKVFPLNNDVPLRSRDGHLVV
jgi:hypothetical protein